MEVLGLFEQKNDKPRPARRPVFAANPTPARKVAEGAMLVATAVIFGLSTAYLPLLWIVAMFLWPIPLALLVRRFGPGFGLVGIGVTAVLLSLFVGPLGALSMLINMGGVGFWYGYAARKNINPALVLVMGVVLAAISMVALIALSAAVAGFELADFSAQIHEMVQFYVTTMQENGNLQPLLGNMTVEEYAAAMEKAALEMVPASLIMMAMFEAVLAYALNSYVFRRLGYPVAKLPPFNEWRLPWYTLWGLIIVLACALGYQQTELPILELIGDNVLYIYQPLLLLAGLSIFYWLAYFWQMPWLVYTMLIMVLFAFNFVGPILVLLGFADSIFDIRSIMRGRQQRNY